MGGWMHRPKVGPLQGPMNPTLSGMNLPVGATGTWGGVIVKNRSEHDLTLQSLRLEGGIDSSDEAVRITKVEVVDTGRLATDGIGVAAGAGHEVIPRHVRKPLQGYRLKSGTTAALLVRYTVEKPGRWRLDRTLVRYEQAGRSSELEMPQALGVCAPVKEVCDVGQPPRLAEIGTEGS